MLSVADLCAWYETGNGPKEIFWGVSFEVREGEILGIFGPNGCGKSTLLRSLANLHPTMTGKVRLDNGYIIDSNISIIPQSIDNSFFNWCSLNLNLYLPCQDIFSKRKIYSKRISDIKKDLGLELDLTLRPGHCSGGMRQQAAIIRSLLNNPKLLIADEPFSALDIEIAQKVRGALRRIIKQRQISAIFILHDMESLIEICDRVLIIPGKPFSTNKMDGHKEVMIIENQHIKDECNFESNLNSNAPPFFIRVIKEVLEP